MEYPGFLSKLRIWEFANVAYMEHLGRLQENDPPKKKSRLFCLLILVLS